MKDIISSPADYSAVHFQVSRGAAEMEKSEERRNHSTKEATKVTIHSRPSPLTPREDDPRRFQKPFGEEP